MAEGRGCDCGVQQFIQAEAASRLGLIQVVDVMSNGQVFEAEALIVVDMQAGFVTGSDAVPQSGDLLDATSMLIEQARAAGALVIFLQNDGPVGAIDEPHRPGWKLYFAPQPEEIIIRKSEDDRFIGSDLNDCLTTSGIRTLAMCGVLSEMCLALYSAIGYAQRLYGNYSAGWSRYV